LPLFDISESERSAAATSSSSIRRGGRPTGSAAVTTSAAREEDDLSNAVFRYPVFPELTSVHVNNDNSRLLVSGHTRNVDLFDLSTGAVVARYTDVHAKHINISRFAHLTPHLFVTSSLDKTAKAWDLRMPTTSAPIYTVQSNAEIIMINFAPNDVYLLTSASDNDITQYLTVDGRKTFTYDIPKTGNKYNFTRAYYSSSGSYVFTGSCEESRVRVMCVATGTVATEVPMYPNRTNDALYIQSLRCGLEDDKFCVLANYRDVANRELVLVEIPSLDNEPADADEGSSMLVTRDSGIVDSCDFTSLPTEDLFATESFSPVCCPTPRLTNDLDVMRRQLKSTVVKLDVTADGTSHATLEIETPDLALVGVDVGFHVGDLGGIELSHTAIIQARCPLLYQ
jgi:WD40 repeat protein